MTPRASPMLVIVMIVLGTLVAPSTYSVPGPGVDDPANVWEPYGPRVNSLLFKYYSGEGPEFTAFENGELDLTDWPVPVSKYAQYDANPDFSLTPVQGEYGMFQIDINMGSTRWFGCDFQFGNSPCGIEIRQAFAHLLDRPRFVTDGPLQGRGQPLADPSPPAKDPAGSSLATQNSWDTLNDQTVAGHNHGQTVNAFNIASDPGGFATIRNGVPDPDLCGARDHLIHASQVDGWDFAVNLGFRDDNLDCIIDNPEVAVANPIRFIIRDDDVRRRTLGDGFKNSIITLFGGANVVIRIACMPTHCGFNPFLSDRWEFYTGGWLLGGPYADHFGTLYHSRQAFDLCGGLPNYGLNIGNICVPDLDTAIEKAENTDSVPLYLESILVIFDEFGKRVLNIPAYSPGGRTVALRDVAGLVNTRGAGYTPTGGGFATLNARNNPNYSPPDPRYAFGGGTNTLRVGQRAGTSTLNMFHASSYWDFYILNNIYDTLITSSPVEPGKIISWMVNKVERTFADVPCNLDYVCDTDGDGDDDITEDTIFLFTLRQNLRFHDGVPVTAEDVKFSFDNYLGVPAENLASNLIFYIDSTVVSPVKLQVQMVGRSVSHLFNLGLPIIPKHLWDIDGDGIADPDKTADEFDPLAAGMLVGSGPFVCRSVFPEDLGRTGTGCSRRPDGSRGSSVIGSGGSLLLEKFDFASISNPFYQYHHSYNPAWPAGGTQSGQFQEWSWADKNNDGRVDSVDLASVAQCVGVRRACPTLADFDYWDKLGIPGIVGAGGGVELQVVASHLDDTWVDPFAWSSTDLKSITPFTP